MNNVGKGRAYVKCEKFNQVCNTVACVLCVGTTKYYYAEVFA